MLIYLVGYLNRSVGLTKYIKNDLYTYHYQWKNILYDHVTQRMINHYDQEIKLISTYMYIYILY